MLELKKTYDITPYVPEILGGQLQTIKLIGLMGYDQARLMTQTDLLDLHSKLIGNIDMLPENVNELTYYLFEDKDQNKIVIAKEYIDLYTVSETSLVNITIKIRGTSLNMVDVLKLRLLEIGITDFDIYPVS
jgi:hypothetical protein